MKANIKISTDKKHDKKANASKKLTNRHNSHKKENKDFGEASVAFQEPSNITSQSRQSKLKSKVFKNTKSGISNESLKKYIDNAGNQCLDKKATSVLNKSNKVALTLENKAISSLVNHTKDDLEVDDQVLMSIMEDKNSQKAKNSPKKRSEKSLVSDSASKLSLKSYSDQTSEFSKSQNSNITNTYNSNLSLSSSEDFSSSTSVSLDNSSSETSSKLFKTVIETKNINQNSDSHKKRNSLLIKKREPSYKSEAKAIDVEKSASLKQTLDHRQAVPQIGS